MQLFLRFFGVVLLSFVLVGLWLDNQFEVSREITIDASPQEIHRYVDDLRQWGEWNPWQTLDSQVVVTVDDVYIGVGASQSWRDQGGGGALTLTESSPAQGIEYDLSFVGDDSQLTGVISYQPSGNQTLVKWTISGEMQPIVIGNYFAQLMETFLANNMAMGLENLKQIAEQRYSSSK